MGYLNQERRENNRDQDLEHKIQGERHFCVIQKPKSLTHNRLFAILDTPKTMFL
jgi:hypothetical protein